MASPSPYLDDQLSKSHLSTYLAKTQRADAVYGGTQLPESLAWDCFVKIERAPSTGRTVTFYGGLAPKKKTSESAAASKALLWLQGFDQGVQHAATSDATVDPAPSMAIDSSLSDNAVPTLHINDCLDYRAPASIQDPPYTRRLYFGSRYDLEVAGFDVTNPNLPLLVCNGFGSERVWSLLLRMGSLMQSLKLLRYDVVIHTRQRADFDALKEAMIQEGISCDIVL